MNFHSLKAQVFKHITIEDGLPSPNVYKIIQDSKGYLWMATYTGGLCRYDGKKIETYTNKEDFASYQARTILEEKDGSLLVGTSFGIYRLKDRVYSKINLDTLRYQVTDILRIDTNHLFISTTICVIEIKDSVRTYHAVNLKKYSNTIIFLGLIKNNKSIYAGSKNGLYKYQEKSKTFEKLNLNYEGDFVVKQGISINDTLILATNKGIVFIYNDKIIKIINIDNSNFISNDISYVYKSKFTNDLWVGGIGVLYKMINDRSFIKYDETYGIDNFPINCILEDTEGNLIISSRGNGIYILIKKLFKNYTEKNKLIDKKIIAISKQNDSILFLLSPSFIYKLNTNTDAISIVSYFANIVKEKFINFTVDKQNNLWLNTIDNKLYQYSILSNTCKEIILNQPFPKINSLTIDLMDRLYICTMNGFYIYKDKHLSWPALFVSSYLFEDIYCDSDSSKFFFTGTNVIKIQKNDTIYLNSNKKPLYVNSMSKDFKGNLWLQASQGLLHYNIVTKEFTFIQKRVEFSTLGFESIHCYQNYLIAGSADGLYVINIKDFYENRKIRYKHFTKNDGMISSIIVSKKSLLDNNGVFWCGTIEGLVKLNFLSNSEAVFNPKLIFSDIDLFYKPLNWEQNGFDAIDNIPTNLILKYYQNNITFKFVAIHYANPEKLVYSFHLKNSEKELEIENITGEINFSDLQPDDYTILVKTKLVGGEWSTNTLSYNFIILAPFYKKTWFYILVIIMIIVSIVIFIKYREKQIREKNKRLEKVVAERTFLLKNANDELNIKSQSLNKSYTELNIKSLQIKDSLEYSENLQKTILNLNSNFNTLLSKYANFELLYRPKDNVSGDFYSAFKKDNLLFIVVADCTGHGVPGALMTILGYNILKQVIVDEENINLEKIFFRVNELFYNVFKSEAVSKNDGMALSVVCVDYKLNTINCLGAQQSIIILDSNNVLNELKFHSTPINYPPQKSYFTQQSFRLSSVARIVLFSDGITDQKGGPDNKFLKKIGFKNWIIEKNSQNEYYSEKLKHWMSASKEQIDDILVLDITFS